ncbi:MAG: sortase [Peptostreptococcaceae bacterium]
MMTKMKNTRSKIFIYSGIVCILISLGLTMFNIYQDKKARISSDKALQEVKNQIPELSELEKMKALISMNDEIGMPVINIDGKEYIGILKIPALSLELPIQSNWDYKLLRSSPCRYQGSIYDNSMIVMAHNYKTHFGSIYRLKSGDEILFTDVNGITYSYSVLGLEKIHGKNVDEMVNNDYDFTLFTCTYGGEYRIAVRCKSND